MIMHKNSFLEDYKKDIDLFISSALSEDIGDGDHTSASCLSNSQTSKANLLVKEAGIIAGVELAEYIFKTQNKDFTFETKIEDGTWVDPGDIVMFDQRLGHIGGPHLNGRDRLVVYGAFGKDNIFTDIQIKSNIKRQKEERLLNPELKFDTYKFPENLQKEFDKAGISYIKEI